MVHDLAHGLVRPGSTTSKLVTNSHLCNIALRSLRFCVGGNLDAAAAAQSARRMRP